jgi:polyisoprenoid-binding protein YceI
MTTLSRRTLTAGRWLPVPESTRAHFAVRQMGGLATVHGRVPVTAAHVDVDEDGAPRAVQATLDLGRLETGNAKRDRDLRKPKLLGSADHPTMTFAGTPAPSQDGWEVAGELVHRATAPVTLAARIVDEAPDGTLTVHATASFDREALGVRAPAAMIGRTIQITIEAAFRPPG